VSLGRIGGVYALLHAGHEVGDHWIQTDDQAEHKGDNGERGQRACVTHVATLTATQMALLTAGCLAAGERLKLGRVAVAFAFNAASHYAADRREHGVIPKLVTRFERLGKHNFYELGDGKAAPCGTGAYALDQALHVGCLAVAAIIIGA
jgi:hypothetical protein